MGANFSPTFTDYSDLKPFRFWCQKVMPAIYDDSLSYYELLTKVVKILNDVIDNLEGVEENTDALLQAFNELQDYVNKYFESDDFSGQIDEGIDRLVESGRLDEIVETAVMADIGGVVAQQIGGVVSDQIDGVVGEQIDGAVGRELPDVIGTQVTDWLDANISGETEVVIDDSLSIQGAAADAKAVGDNAMLFRGYVNEIGYTDLSNCKACGWYGFTGAYVASITDLPTGFSGAGCLIVYKPTYGGSIFYIQELHSYSDGNVYWVRNVRKPDSGGTTTIGAWVKRDNYDSTKGFVFRGYLGDLNITELTACASNGWYGFTAEYSQSIIDLPDGFNGAGTVNVYSPSFGSNIFLTQVVYDTYGNVWYRLVRSGVARTWVKVSGENALAGKTVAIIGDSISTSGDYSDDNPLGNVPEVFITADDVNVPLTAHVTYYDVGVTVGGYTIQIEDVGTELGFTPNAGDVGKMVGKPLTYYSSPNTVWWKKCSDKLGFTPISVSWSGASVSSHSNDGNILKGSHAWSDGTINKCGIRTVGTNNRTAPDYIIIARGINDFSHTPYDRLTEGYFDNYDWSYPDTDIVDGNYGFKEALCLTIKKLRNAYPNAVIVLCTLNFFKRVNYSHFPVNNGINSVPQYNQAILEVADFMGCEVIEFDKDGITFENCISGEYYGDSNVHPTHPNAKGQTIMANRAMLDLNNKLNMFK